MTRLAAAIVHSNAPNAAKILKHALTARGRRPFLPFAAEPSSTPQTVAIPPALRHVCRFFPELEPIDNEDSGRKVLVGWIAAARSRPLQHRRPAKAPSLNRRTRLRSADRLLWPVAENSLPKPSHRFREACVPTGGEHWHCLDYARLPCDTRQSPPDSGLNSHRQSPGDNAQA